MKEKIQQRINQIRDLAKNHAKGHNTGTSPFRVNDSLSKSIRNSKEANLFLAELDAAFKVAQTKID